MDKITQSFLNAFVASEGLGSLPVSDSFERFVNYAIITPFVAETLNIDEVSVGSGGDTGLDGIAILVNGSIVTDTDEVESLVNANGYLDVDFILIQAKSSENFSGSDIGNFFFGVLDFFRETPQLTRNPLVREAARVQSHIYSLGARMNRRRPRLHLFYVTTGKWVNDKELSGRIASLKKDVDALAMFEEVLFTPMGARELQDAYQGTQRKVTAEFQFVSKIVLDVPGVSQAYLGVVPAKEFIRIVSDSEGKSRKSVFYDNVRDFQDYNPVNGEIRNTLESAERGRFVLMNNGVTIIAKSLQPIGNRFVITDYQIVNGCQTSHVILDSARHLDESVQVPVKLIVSDDEGVTTSIIKATNRQTEVKPQQLYALSDFQKQLEAYYAATTGVGKLFYERRSRQYAGDSAVEKVRVVPIQQQLRVFAAMFLDQAHKGHYARSLDSQVGSEIFVQGHRLEPYYASALAHYRLEYFFRTGSLGTELKPLRYALLMAARHLYAGDMPSMISNKMQKYAEGLVEVLVDDGAALDLFGRASEVVNEAIGTRQANRELTKTQTFTAEVIAVLNSRSNRGHGGAKGVALGSRTMASAKPLPRKLPSAAPRPGRTSED